MIPTPLLSSILFSGLLSLAPLEQVDFPKHLLKKLLVILSLGVWWRYS